MCRDCEYAVRVGNGYTSAAAAEGKWCELPWQPQTIWGDTILEGLVPLFVAIYFFIQRQTTAFERFSSWKIGFLHATYMADMRATLLPLVQSRILNFEKGRMPARARTALFIKEAHYRFRLSTGHHCG
jgi:hypothetical protein